MEVVELVHTELTAMWRYQAEGPDSNLLWVFAYVCLHTLELVYMCTCVCLALCLCACICVYDPVSVPFCAYVWASIVCTSSTTRGTAQ
jgi:hypothetical protein